MSHKNLSWTLIVLACVSALSLTACKDKNSEGGDVPAQGNPPQSGGSSIGPSADPVPPPAPEPVPAPAAPMAPPADPASTPASQ